ncbi:formate dehydrogenase N subunit beta transmembrane domain-containing protein [Paracoccus aerius]
MIAHANERVEDLKSRGYENAGIYDPAGVGGTHVFYVLHHADKPSIYDKLPENPRISPVVEGWKGVTKTAGLAVMGVAAVGAAIHGIFARANKVDEHEEKEAEKLVVSGGSDDRGLSDAAPPLFRTGRPDRSTRPVTVSRYRGSSAQTTGSRPCP